MFISISDDIGVIVLTNSSNYNAIIQIENVVFDFAEDTAFIILGDINQDGIVDVLDVIILVNHILSPAAVELDGADINNDGEVNILDVIALVNIILSN